MKDLNDMLCRFWEIDNSGMESLPAINKRESLILGKSITFIKDQ